MLHPITDGVESINEVCAYLTPMLEGMLRGGGFEWAKRCVGR